MQTLTPPHHSLQLVIPGPDTQPPTTDFKLKRPPYGLETPPPSAHNESRRGSLHSLHSLTDLAFETGVSGRAHLDPSTPVHQIIHGWPDVAASSASGVSHHSGGHLLSPGFPSHTFHTPSAHIVPIYQHVQQPLCSNPPPLHVNVGLSSVASWTGAVPHTNAFEPSMNFLGPELFPVTESLPLGSSFSSSSSHRPGPSLQSYLALNDQDRSLPPGLIYNEPHTIELPPPDRYDHPQVEYAAFDDDDDGTLSRNLTSSTMSFGFEFVEPPSPMNDYMENRSDAEDFAFIKAEEDRIKHETKMRQSGIIKRHSSKRCKKRNVAWHQHEAGGIEVSCEGPQFRIDRPESHVPGINAKPHACTYLKDNGERCPARFQRSEHLKRHMGSHTNERSFVCPIKECVKNKKGCQRPDNAGDHFRTHLRPPKNGKRNCHVEWDWLRPAILGTYENKRKAQNVIKNLQSWMDKGMPDTSSRRPTS